jgi:hypothetical protein
MYVNSVRTYVQGRKDLKIITNLEEMTLFQNFLINFLAFG